MVFPEYLEFDGIGLADLVRRGKVSANELLDVAIARVDALDPETQDVAPARVGRTHRRLRERVVQVRVDQRRLAREMGQVTIEAVLLRWVVRSLRYSGQALSPGVTDAATAFRSSR